MRYRIEEKQNLGEYSKGVQELIANATAARKDIFLWQTLQMLGFYTAENVMQEMGFFLVDVDSDTAYPVYIGELFPTDTVFAGESYDFKVYLEAADKALYHVKEHGRKGFWKESAVCNQEK